MKRLTTFVLLAGAGAGALAQNMTPVSQEGITVGPPSVYDTYYLQQKLQGLKTQLEGLQVLSSATLTGHIGNVQGADLQQVGVSVQGGGASTPSVTTAAGSPTSSSTTPLAAPNPSVSASSMSLPTPSQSSLDTLNESMQLAYEITNLELVLDGALNDKIDPRTGHTRRVITLGFPVSFSPPSDRGMAKERTNSVAEIHVTLCRPANDVSIMAVLPQERTYNVAGLVDHSVAASLGGVIGGVFSVGGGFLWHHQRYDLVQQQETVALQRASGVCGDGSTSTASFAWQVYPVLGAKQVRSGKQEDFVQLSVPGDTTPAKGSEIAKACVEVGWRTTAKGGTVVFEPGMGKVGAACYEVPYFSTRPNVQNVEVANTGGGNVLVTAKGDFLPGTQVRVGGTLLAAPAISISPEGKILKMQVSAADLVAAGGATLVSREGDEVQLANHGGGPNDTPLTVDNSDIFVQPFSDALARVTLRFTPPAGSQLPPEPCTPMPGDVSKGNCIPTDQWVVTVAGNTYGLADAPFLGIRDLPGGKKEISLLVPAAGLTATARITLQRLLWSRNYYYWQGYLTSNAISVKTPTVTSGADGLHLALVGSNLDKAVVQYPTGCAGCLRSVQPSFALLEVSPEQAKSLKQVILCQRDSGGGCDPAIAPVILDLPKEGGGDSPSKPVKPVLKPGATVTVGAATATIGGTGLEQITSVRYGNAEVTVRLSLGDKPEIMLDLPASIAKRAGKYALRVEFADKTTQSYLLTVKAK